MIPEHPRFVRIIGPKIETILNIIDDWAARGSTRG